MEWDFEDAYPEGCQQQFLDYLKEVVETKNFDAFVFNYETKPKKTNE